MIATIAGQNCAMSALLMPSVPSQRRVFVMKVSCVADLPAKRLSAVPMLFALQTTITPSASVHLDHSPGTHTI